MGKFKVSTKNEQLVVKKRLDKGVEINQRELEILKGKLLRGIMRPKVEAYRKITFYAPKGITLQKYLNNEVSVNDYFLLITQLVEVVRKIERNGLNLNNLILNMQYVFINETTKEMQYIYQPIFNTNIVPNIYSFFQDIVYMSKVNIYDDNINAVREFTSFARSIHAFDVAEIEAYILKTYPEVYRQIQRDKTEKMSRLKEHPWDDSGNIGNINQNREKQNKSNDGPPTELLGGNRKNTSTMILDEEESDTELLVEENESQTVKFEENYYQTELIADDIGFNDERKDLPKTTLLGESVQNRNDSRGYEGISSELRKMHLVRSKQFVKIHIDRPTYRIGKDPSQVHYCIMDNPAISRHHADIMIRADKCYVIDNDSKNNTFVNGIKLDAKKPKEVHDKDILVLADEVFEIHME